MTLTKEEQIQAVYDLKAGYTLGNTDIAILKGLARMALAGMEAEPVAWRWNYGGTTSWRLQETKPNYGDNHKFPRVIQPLYTAPQPLTTSERTELEDYRNAQQVVPELKPVGYLFVSDQGAVAYSPTDFGLAGFSLAGQIFGDIAPHRAAMLQGKAEPAKTGLTLREGLAAIRISGIAIDAEKILAERDALNEPTCWCRTCRPVTVTDMRFVVCPQCGNKRCPHANDCRNACTGSNEPGQEGSAYPDAPQQEA